MKTIRRVRRLGEVCFDSTQLPRCRHAPFCNLHGGSFGKTAETEFGGSFGVTAKPSRAMFPAHPPSPMSPHVRPPAGTLAPSSSRRHRHVPSTWPTLTHPSRWFFPSYQQTPRRPALAPGMDRNAAQQWPKHLGRPSPPHGHPVGPPTPPQGLPPPHGHRAPCHRNAAAWSIGTRLALVQTISLPPHHPCTCTPQTKNRRNLHRVATTHS